MNRKKKPAAATEPKTKQAGVEKAAAMKDTTAAHTEPKAKVDSFHPAVIVQFQGSEVDASTLVAAAAADFHQSEMDAPITDLKLYVKPEERTAYYVVNGAHSGSVSY